MKFTFNFTKDTCSKLKTGICELDRLDLASDRKQNDECLKDLSRCQRIYFGLIDKTIKTLPQIMKCECGHYICSDGQHRICVAQKKKLRLDVRMLGAINENCEKCMPTSENDNTVNVIIDGIKFSIIKK